MPAPTRALALAVLLATALLLAACGGSDEATESTPAANAPPASGIQYGDREMVPAPERQPKAKPKDRVADESGGTKGEEKGSGKQGKSRQLPAGDNSNGSPPSKETERSPECPKAMSAEQCVEAGQAYEKSANSRPVPADQCPPSVDAATCEEAGRAYAEAKDGGRPVQPDECPPAMTEEQCRIAGEAYAEASN